MQGTRGNADSAKIMPKDAGIEAHIASFDTEVPRERLSAQV
jgi:hypothetical protein